MAPLSCAVARTDSRAVSSDGSSASGTIAANATRPAAAAATGRWNCLLLASSEHDLLRGRPSADNGMRADGVLTEVVDPLELIGGSALDGPRMSIRRAACAAEISAHRRFWNAKRVSEPGIYIAHVERAYLPGEPGNSCPCAAAPAPARNLSCRQHVSTACTGRGTASKAHQASWTFEDPPDGSSTTDAEDDPCLLDVG